MVSSNEEFDLGDVDSEGEENDDSKQESESEKEVSKFQGTCN